MTPLPDQAEQGRLAIHGLSLLLERAGSWLVVVGTWIFGGLIALNLVVIAALITVGPTDRTVLISVTSFACALPLEVAGIVLLRLSKDVEEIGLESLTLQSFEEAGFRDIHAHLPAPSQRESAKKRSVRVTLGYALAMAALSLALTTTGIVAALWHMAPWVAEAFLAMALLSGILIVLALRHSLPPESDAERTMKAETRKRQSAEKLGRPGELGDGR
ncbi:MAG TPA: hypothetical protein VMJ70_16025 [Candidatus Sulfotelmatobacter sp.]|nr:hypothetical protein [Candidatus Sulfotelmatobacter sp.]